MHNDISAEAVYEMSTSKAFQERKCRDAGALSWDVQITEGPDGASVKTKRKLPTVGFPSLLRRFLNRGTPVITGLSATYLYRAPREVAETNVDDDIRGEPVISVGLRFRTLAPEVEAPPPMPHPIDTKVKVRTRRRSGLRPISHLETGVSCPLQRVAGVR